MEIFDGSTTPVNYNYVFSSITAARNKYAGLGRSTASAVPLVDYMRRTRSQFKLALRSCKKNEEQLKSDALARDLLENNYNDSWKHVKRMSNSKVPPSNVIGNATNDLDIADIWKSHFYNLHNQRDNKDLFNDVNHKYRSDNNVIISVNCLSNVMCNLKLGKSVGEDGIAAEALVYGGNLLSVHLTLLFNMCIAHSYLPYSLMSTTIVPVVKDKTGDMTDRNNYRAIAISNAMANLLECVITDCFKNCNVDNDIHQFGFKAKHSTIMACSILKHVINYYRNNGSYVFVSLLDLSKAFDLVDHHILFNRLIDLKLPCNLVHILAFWYRFQTMNVKWNSILSSSFPVSNGTKQGSVLSPLLFSLYIKPVSKAITTSQLGCYIGNMPCNVLLYADDLVLISPSYRAHQLLLNICSFKIDEIKMTLNVKKSISLVFSPYAACRRFFRL